MGQLLHAELEYIQLHVGTTNCFLLESFSQRHQFVNHTWICTIWEFLHHFKLLLQLHNFPLPQPQREFDISIMDAIIQSSAFNLQELIHINKFRLYLQLYFLSDLILPSSTKLHPSIQKGFKDPCYTSSFHWPDHQPMELQRAL